VEDCLERDIHPDYVVQYLPLELLRGDDPRVAFKGVALGGWHVLHHECVTFRSTVSPWRVERYVYLVLGGQSAAPPQRAAGGGMCRD
jgi:hypothetical protein